MSFIFPTSPATVKVSLLPSNAEFISYSVQPDRLDIHAWMPANIASYIDNNMIWAQGDRFYSQNCANCRRNTYSYLTKTYPDYVVDSVHGKEFNFTKFYNIDYKKHNECDVYYRGFNPVEKLNGCASFTCQEGQIFEELEKIENIISNMLFRGSFDIDTFEMIHSNAHLRAGYVSENGTIFETSAGGAANVYGNDTQGGICWGSLHNYPENLRSLVASYFSTEFNSDLLSLTQFKRNCAHIERIKTDSNNFFPNINKKFLCSGYDAFMFINGDHDVQAFFTMLMAGFKPLENLNHIMLIPLKTSTIHRGEDCYLGFVTQEDVVGRKWYVSTENYLIGQLDESFVCA